MNEREKMFTELFSELNVEHLEKMKDDFGDNILNFENDDWTETEKMAYDLGFANALMVIVKTLKENGEAEEWEIVGFNQR